MSRRGGWLSVLALVLGALSSLGAHGGSFEERCARVATPAKPMPVFVDTEERLIEPLPFGPALDERIWTGLPRTEDELRETLETARDLLKRCYRWALRDRPGLRAELRIELEMDHFGILRAVGVEADTAEGSGLAGCARDVLQGLQDVQPLYTRRLTRAGLTVRFRPADPAPVAGDPPSRPSAPPLGESFNLCMQLPQEPPVDRIRLKEPVWAIDDRPPKRKRSRSFTCSCLDLGQRPLLQAMDHNLGACRKCYTEALTRKPGLAGRVVFVIEADLGGGITGVEPLESDLDDDTLVACLQDSLARVWTWPLGRYCTNTSRSFPRLRVPFRLRPGATATVPRQPAPGSGGLLPVVELEAWARERLSSGDGRRAGRAYALLLQHRPEHPNACRWHAAALRAALSEAPWIDRRVLDGLDRLARYTRRHPDEDLKECLDPLTETFKKIGYEPLGYTWQVGRRGFYQVAAGRLRHILAIGDALPAEQDFRRFLALALYNLGRYREARPEFERVSRNHPDADKRKEALGLAEECRQKSTGSDNP